MANIEFNAVKHEYTVDGRIIPSVTQILTSVGMYKYDGINPQILNQAADRGSTVHKIIEFHEKGILDERSIDPELDGYFMAYIRCRKAHGFEKLNEFEKVIYSDKFRYCGTLDACGEGIIIDHKTGQSSPVHGLQLSAYWLATHPNLGDKPRALACAYYHPDGAYDYVEYEYQPLTFISCLSAYNWKVQHGV